MNVEVLESTDNAEQVICKAARGDYMSGWNARESFDDIMSVVNCEDRHHERAADNNYYPDETADTEAKMIAFLEKQYARGHFGPAEHAHISLSVEGVSRSAMAQITRHRHMSFDVQSQRYVDFSEKRAVMPRSMESDASLSREKGLVDLDERAKEKARYAYEEVTEQAFEAYETLVDQGVPKEDARFVLPEGTPVNMTISGNARSMMHVLNLRQKASSQWEIRELANRIGDILEGWIPYTGHWFSENAPLKISP